MVVQVETSIKPEPIGVRIYPESDGQPMADNTKQFRWIVLIKENLEILFAENADVFVAGDLLWYPVEGMGRCQAPDVMVVFGRPKGDRGSYKQWEENGIPPLVVFEIISPSNTVAEMSKKMLFYQEYGVEEYYIYDPEKGELVGSVSRGDRLAEIEPVNGWVSPRLGVRFELGENGLVIYHPDGERFLSPVELARRREQAEGRVKILEAKLRELGIDPEVI
ncbi:MAG TPA: Uma2 family endonuclease [Oscillatoriaceae cyanobacterium M33_DOE_052]|uniref:Uma2 family endonuclease n=1 Tax=Planktothricoides sp. SpSt-374 TaxID=2282167 RepID=A0A7C3VTN1_9CYAN|nr:Uma2 family endonuclease [Oscillatoriaceae cyanobacterium M33_DOE_052]